MSTYTMVKNVLKSFFSLLFLLCISLSATESVLVHFMADDGLMVESLAEKSSEEDSKEEKTENEAKKESDKIFQEQRLKSGIADSEDMILLHLQSEHSFKAEVEIPPPEGFSLLIRA